MAEKEKKQIEKEKAEAQKNYLNDLKTYSYGAVAGRALKDGDANRANVSLDKLVEDMFKGEEDKLDGLLAGIYATEKGTQTAVSVYASKYQNALANLTVSNLWNFSGDLSDKYIGDLKSKATEEVGKFGDVEFGKIQEKYLSAKEIVDSKTKNFSKEKKEKAEKDVKKYEKVMITIQTLEDAYLDKYNSGVTDESRKLLFKNLYGEKPKEE